jgi:hypothetical protein
LRSGSVEVGKFADLVLWNPKFFGVKPELVIKGGHICMLSNAFCFSFFLGSFDERNLRRDLLINIFVHSTLHDSFRLILLYFF